VTSEVCRVCLTRQHSSATPPKKCLDMNFEAKHDDLEAKAVIELVDSDLADENNPLDDPPLFIIALVNPTSGGQAGNKILKHLRKNLKAEQGEVFSLFDEAAMVAAGLKGETRDECGGLFFQWHIFDRFSTIHTDHRLVLVVCGGDGTVVWAINAMMMHKGMCARKYPSAVAVQPLGTGNDLARHLNWGSGLSELPHPASLIPRMKDAHIVEMDRWAIEISPRPLDTTSFGSRNVEEADVGNTVWMNYFSIGVDSKIAHQFESCRSSCKSLFCSQLGNKLWYTCLGGCNTCYCMNVAKCINVEVDLGEGWISLDVETSAQSLVAVNIGSWASGVDIWGSKNRENGEFAPATIDDGMLELAGVDGAAQIGRATVFKSCAKFKRFSQAKSIRYTVTRPLHMQLDGEAWLQPSSETSPTTVVITPAASVLMFLPESFQATCGCF